MDGVRSYLISVVAVSMIAVLACALVRKGQMQKLVRFTAGILVLLTAISPLLRLDLRKLADRLQEAESAIAYDPSRIAGSSREMLISLIKSNTETYIEDKAASLGATVQAEVAVSGEEYPAPNSVVVTGTLSAEQVQALEAYLEDALGIPRERQEWKLYG